MAELSDVYGDNFQTESAQARVNHTLNNIAKNLAHRVFDFRSDTLNASEVWQNQNNLPTSSVTYLCQKIQSINPKMSVQHLNKQNEQHMRMIPQLIIKTPVEYFLIIDAEMKRAYLIYMTPAQVGAY